MQFFHLTFCRCWSNWHYCLTLFFSVHVLHPSIPVWTSVLLNLQIVLTFSDLLELLSAATRALLWQLLVQLTRFQAEQRQAGTLARWPCIRVWLVFWVLDSVNKAWVAAHPLVRPPWCQRWRRSVFICHDHVHMEKNNRMEENATFDHSSVNNPGKCNEINSCIKGTHKQKSLSVCDKYGKLMNK